MSKKYVDLTPAQKDEIRRLAQLANRRIKAADRAYSKEGKEVLPFEIAGPYQVKERWHTKNTPISRSVKFESLKDYREHLKFLRSFDPKATKAHRPGIKEYTEIQRHKTALATATSLDFVYSYEKVLQKLAKLTAPQLAEFWNTFSDKAAKAGMNYSSEAVMEQTFAELYKEDLVSLLPTG